MSNEMHAYETIVSEKAKELEQTVGHAVSHGSEGTCPTCGHVGQYDLKGFGLSGASIYFATVVEKWRCMLCELDAVGY